MPLFDARRCRRWIRRLGDLKSNLGLTFATPGAGRSPERDGRFRT